MGEEAQDVAGPVPRWLVVLVISLAVSVVATGAVAFTIMGAGDRYASPAERSIEVLSAALAQDPTDTQARLALGYAYQQAGQFKAAVSEYDSVLEGRPDELAALYNRGLCLIELSQTDEGEDALRQTLAAHPGHALAARALSVRLMEREEWAELAEILLPVLEADPGAADLQALLGRAYEELGDTKRARERYELGLTYYPEMTEALEGLQRLEVTP